METADTPGCYQCIWHCRGIATFLRWKTDSVEYVWCMLVGIVLYLISILSHGKVGKGDAFLVTSMGVYLGFWNNLTILWMASVMAAIFGVVACVFFRKEKEESLPFVPFLLVAYLLFLCLGAATAKAV